MIRTMQQWCNYISTWRLRKGFHTPENIIGINGDNMLGKLMLITAEIGEAAEAVRHNDIKNFKEELADAIIRIFDICGTMKIDIEEEINSKMVINEDRPIRHGKQITL